MTATPDQFDQPIKRRVAILWNLIFSYGSLGIVLIRNIALFPLYLIYIDLNEFNGWAATGGILIALTQIDFGLLGVITQQAAVAYGNRDREKLARVLGTGLVCSAVLCLLLFAVIGLAAPWIPYAVGLRGAVATRVAWCFLIVAGSNSLQLLGYVAGGVMRSLQRPFIPGLLRLISESTALGLSWYLVMHGWGLYAIAAGVVGRSVVELVGNITVFAWTSGKLQIRLRAERKFARELLTLSGFQFMTQIARALKLGIDPFLVGVFMPAPAALIFTATLKAAETVRLLIVQIPTAIAPSLSHLYGEGNTQRFRSMIFVMFRVQVAVSAIGSAGVIAFNHPFMELWLRQSHANVTDLFGGYLISGLIGVWCFGTLASMASYEILFTMGEFTRLSALLWLEQVVRIAGMIPFLLGGMLWGAPAVSLLAQAWALNWLQNKLLVQKAGLQRSDVWEIVWIHVRHMITPIICIGLFMWLAPMPAGWIELGLQAGVFCLICGIASMLLDRQFAQLIVRRGQFS